MTHLEDASLIAAVHDVDGDYKMRRWCPAFCVQQQSIRSMRVVVVMVQALHADMTHF